MRTGSFLIIEFKRIAGRAPGALSGPCGTAVKVSAKKYNFLLYSPTMPLGDPGGCNFEYTTEGLPVSVAFVEIPVRDVERAVRFYSDVLKMNVTSQNDVFAIMELNAFKITLTKDPAHAGKDTGLYLSVGNPFDFNRRMVDEGVIIIRHPAKGPHGVYASFKDDDGNVIHVIS